MSDWLCRPPKMSDYNERLLRKVEQNDSSLTKLSLNNTNGAFDFNRLGRAIARNTNLTELDVRLQDLANIDTGFYVGLKRNTSINKLHISGGRYRPDLSGVGCEILQAYQENNTHLTHLKITHCNIQNQGYNIITTTLQCCTNLRMINLYQCDVTADQLLPMIEAMRDLRSLHTLFLNFNSIGDAGCEAIATLLEDPYSNIQSIYLQEGF